MTSTGDIVDDVMMLLHLMHARLMSISADLTDFLSDLFFAASLYLSTDLIKLMT
jgi:hypothetical protein